MNGSMATSAYTPRGALFAEAGGASARLRSTPGCAKAVGMPGPLSRDPSLTASWRSNCAEHGPQLIEPTVYGIKPTAGGRPAATCGPVGRSDAARAQAFAG